jgi:hypothetical protein
MPEVDLAHSPLDDRRTSDPHSLATELNVIPIAPRMVRTAVSGIVASKKSPAIKAPPPANRLAICPASLVPVISRSPPCCGKLVDPHYPDAFLYLGGGRRGR